MTTKKTYKAKKDVYQEVTNQIIEHLKTGSIPWVRGWKDTGSSCNFALPHNAATGRNYSGVNIMILWMNGEQYSNDGWVTYKQAKDLGGNIIKGESGTSVTFFKIVSKASKTEGQEDSRFAMQRFYTVFNIEQCENIDESKLAAIRENKAATEPQNAAYDFSQSCGASVTHGGNQAFHERTKNRIQMPHIDQFSNENVYAATLLHELTHWTGDKKRLDRKKGVNMKDSEYAKEELIAELGSAFLCSDLGVMMEEPRHAAYIQSWLKALENDNKLIFQAAAAAQKSCNYLHELAVEEEAAKEAA